MQIFNVRPKDNRCEIENNVYDMLENLEIDYSRVDHSPANTIEDCIEIDKALGTNMCKNLFLCNTSKTHFYLLLMPGDKHFSTKDLSKQINSSRLSFAPSEYMEKYLGVTPGSVTVLGLMNDKEHNVKLLIDSDILKDEYVGCHPCVNTSSLKIRTNDILDKFLKATGHFYTEVVL